MLPFGIGLGEVLLILVVILLVVGPHKLPDMAKTVGKGLRTVRKASRDLRDAVDLDDVKQQVYQPIRQWEQQQRIEEAELFAEEARKANPPSTRNAEPVIDPAVADTPISKPPQISDGEAGAKPATASEDAAHPELLNDGDDLLDEDAVQIVARASSSVYKKPRLPTPDLTTARPTGLPNAEDDGPDQPT